MNHIFHNESNANISCLVTLLLLTDFFFLAFWQGQSARFQKLGLFTAHPIYANAPKSRIQNDQSKAFFVQGDLACPVTICRSFTLRPREPGPVTYTARRHRHTLPSAARSPGRSSLRGNAAALPPPGPQRAPQPRSLATGTQPPTLWGREPPGTQARQLGHAASAAMTATPGSAPRAKARGPLGWEESRLVCSSVRPPEE